MLTCKQFLHELNDYLEETLDPATRETLQRHVDECPNCWVVYNTTKRTIEIYKGCDPAPVPKDTHARLMEALRRKMEVEGPCCKKAKEQGKF